MTKQLWPMVYSMLLKAISQSKPYDLDGGIRLLHAIDSNADMPHVAGARIANLTHLTAVISGEREVNEAARNSIINMIKEIQRYT